MAWWDSSSPYWLENLVPILAQETNGFRAELRLTMTARSMRKIKMLASDISVYFPNHPLITGRRPGYFQTTFPRVCDFIEKTLIELSRTLMNDPRSEASVAWQLQDMLDGL
ncbi:hypothetical protein N7449_009347 [Penicillium cf. viridicatum]|uniref:Uncharacterized protein n=1 Tax=Penicillium cf. viridicatum TaxID=2972119 RepID=A0A9W9JA78_9EURO|nr:hypothetical protein N7449_009347 [Penicillium cf. viridicatum]